jgi:hypothetical protein
MNVVLLLACGKLRQVCYHVHFPTMMSFSYNDVIFLTFSYNDVILLTFSYNDVMFLTLSRNDVIFLTFCPTMMCNGQGNGHFSQARRSSIPSNHGRWVQCHTGLDLMS